MKTIVIIPTFLEAENIADVLGRVRTAVPHADVLVVDDSSPDGTADLARATGDELSQIDVLLQPDKGGLGVAYRAGFARGFENGYDVLIQMDADLSHDPSSLPDLLAKIEGGADMAIGSRYVPGGNIPHWPMARRLLSRIGNLYASKVLGLRINDCTSGFRAYRATVLREVEATRATGYGFQVELAYRAHRRGATIVEVPITFNDRVRGESKMSWHIIGEAMSLVTWWGLRDRVLRRNKPVERSTRDDTHGESPPSPAVEPAAAATASSTDEPADDTDVAVTTDDSTDAPASPKLASAAGTSPNADETRSA